MDQVTNPKAGVAYRGSLCVADAHRCTQVYSKPADVPHHQYLRTHFVIDQGYQRRQILLWLKKQPRNLCLTIDVLILDIPISIENHAHTLLFHSSNQPSKCAHRAGSKGQTQSITTIVSKPHLPLKIIKNDKGGKGVKGFECYRMLSSSNVLSFFI